MPRFDKSTMQELKDFIYNSGVHDAKLVNVEYKCFQDALKMELFNPISNVHMNLCFRKIGIVLAIQGKFLGSRETILSLAAEEDFSHLQNYLPNLSEDFEDSLYLLFQMFSGDELHIVSREVSVE